MSRKKPAKHTAKRHTTQRSHVSAQKAEKDFMQVHAMLSSKVKKEVASLKQKEAKLKKIVNNIGEEIKVCEKRLKDTLKMKHTPAGKKQWIIAKTKLKNTKTMHAPAKKQLQETSKALVALNLKQAKLIAMRKHLNQFEKEWAKNSKKLKMAAKAKTKGKTKAKVKPMIAKAKVHAVPEVIAPAQPPYETFETTMDTIMLDEAPEIAS